MAKILILLLLCLTSACICTESPKLIDKIEESHPVSYNERHQGIHILNVLVPFQGQEKKPHPSSPLEELEREINGADQISKSRLTEISALINSFQVNAEIISLQELVEELEQGNYTSIEIKKYLSKALQQTGPVGSQLDERVNELFRKVMNGAYSISPRSTEDSGHSPSFLLTDNKTQQPFAILKQSEPEYFSSFQRILPNLHMTAPVWEHELIGYEQDQIFGFDNTPATLSVRFINSKHQLVHGTIQAFIPNARPGGDFYTSQGADLLKSIPYHAVHLVALSGMFKGLSAGQMNNYLLSVSPSDPEQAKIYEIDLEEMLLPYNRLGDAEIMTNMGNDEEKNEMMRRSLILCRMWVIGLPQSTIPFDRAALMLLADPTVISRLKHYHKAASAYSSLSQDSWKAQLERVQSMQDIARLELEKDTPTLTPRKLYLLIFGGEHLWKIAQQKKYPAMIAFNNLVSDPYQHIIKDFSNPESIPMSTSLEKPRDNSQEAKDIFEFLRKMEL